MLKRIIQFIKNLKGINFSATGIKNEFNAKIQKAENCNECNITINNNGLTYNDVKSIALDIYNSNFPKLAEIAKETACRRINEYIEEKILLIDNNKLNKFSDVGIQYDFSNILKAVAIRGNGNINDLLTNVLLDRLCAENDFDSITLSSIIDKVTKISLQELNVLGLFALTKKKQIDDISEQTIIKLLEINEKRCNEYCSTLASNGLVHWTGGFAYYPNHIEENEIKSVYIKHINEIFKQNIFVNFDFLHCGEVIAYKYLDMLNNKK